MTAALATSSCGALAASSRRLQLRQPTSTALLSRARPTGMASGALSTRGREKASLAWSSWRHWSGWGTASGTLLTSSTGSTWTLPRRWLWASLSACLRRIPCRASWCQRGAPRGPAYRRAPVGGVGSSWVRTPCAPSRRSSPGKIRGRRPPPSPSSSLRATCAERPLRGARKSSGFPCGVSDPTSLTWCGKGSGSRRQSPALPWCSTDFTRSAAIPRGRRISPN
mmetsp:Transcript_31743/g.67540  ORF Transcript_31743/g.67540 Transcript_31743/m.67540 type:complete len:224 (+) Transcript_31743:1466-2137(+)